MPAINTVKLSAAYCVKSTSFISWQLSQECGKNENRPFLPAAIFRMDARRGSAVVSAFLDPPRQRSHVHDRCQLCIDPAELQFEVEACLKEE